MMSDILAKFQDQLSAAVDQVILYLPRLAGGLLAGVVLLVCIRLIRRWAVKIARRTTPEVELLIVNGIFFSSLAVAIIIVLSVLGVNVLGLVAGLGLSGLAVGFALKDIIENLLAGALILIQRPFDLGEVIELEGTTGHVTNIQMRSTTLKTLDNLEVVIPNRTVYGAIIKNYSTYPIRRRQVSLGFGYEVNLGEAMQMLMDKLHSIEGVADDPAPFITLTDFGDSAVAGMLYYYIDTKQFDYASTHTSVIQALQEAVREHEIDLPYPTQVVINR